MSGTMCLHGTDRNVTSVVHYSSLQDKYNNSSECTEITANSTKTCNREKVTTTMKSNQKNSHLQCSKIKKNQRNKK